MSVPFYICLSLLLAGIFLIWLDQKVVKPYEEYKERKNKK